MATLTRRADDRERGRAPLVARCRHLPAVRTVLAGQQRRRVRRPARHHRAARLLVLAPRGGPPGPPPRPSPAGDGGYDVSDYPGVHPDLGTLADLDELIDQADQRGMRVLLDL